MGKGKPRGLLAARKLRNHRREGKWADLHYKKRLLGTAFKSSPFGVRPTTTTLTTAAKEETAAVGLRCDALDSNRWVERNRR